MSSIGAEWVVVDKAQTHCPRLEGLIPWFFWNRNRQDTHELLNEYFAASLECLREIRGKFLFFVPMNRSVLRRRRLRPIIFVGFSQVNWYENRR